jgi:hypothetical protein
MLGVEVCREAWSARFVTSGLVHQGGPDEYWQRTCRNPGRGEPSRIDDCIGCPAELAVAARGAVPG